MSEGLNKVQLIGNLGQDCELKTTQGGTSVLKLRLACTERQKDKNDQWTDRVEWVNVTVWAARAEGLAKVLSKGSSIYVEGSLRTSSYEDKNGEKRYSTEVNANKVLLLGGKRESSGNDEAPRAARQPAQQQRRAPSPPVDDFPDDDSQMPF
jgi:single-strand DNA-binding protein